VGRAAENLKEHPGFYLRTVGSALWEYANTFGPRSRTAPQYKNWYSRASEGQSVLGIYLVSLIVAAWLLQNERRLSAPSLALLIALLGLFLFYRILPVWLTFVPVIVGIVFSWRSKTWDPSSHHAWKSGPISSWQRGFRKPSFVSGDSHDRLAARTSRSP